MKTWMSFTESYLAIKPLIPAVCLRWWNADWVPLLVWWAAGAQFWIWNLDFCQFSSETSRSSLLPFTIISIIYLFNWRKCNCIRLFIFFTVSIDRVTLWDCHVVKQLSKSECRLHSCDKLRYWLWQLKCCSQRAFLILLVLKRDWISPQIPELLNVWNDSV